MSQPTKPHPLGLGRIVREWPDGTAVVVIATAGDPLFLVITPDDEILNPDGGVRPLIDALTHPDGLDFGSQIDAELAVESRRSAHPENR